uniref:Ig-like domain-containing protein n=1 Tax=Ornithorhynchus anatinus TaxID=9258 RepID=F6Z724_ORNAN
MTRPSLGSQVRNPRWLWIVSCDFQLKILLPFPSATRLEDALAKAVPAAAAMLTEDTLWKRRQSLWVMIPIMLIWQISYWHTEAMKDQERKVVTVGSSVPLSAPLRTSSSQLIQWEFIGDIPLQVIVEYSNTTGRMTVYPPYKGRVQFSPENSSLLLMNVQETDSGTYKVVFDLNEKEAKKTLLKVIKPISKPQMRINTSLTGSAARLSCEVAEGQVDAVVWMKDGQPLPPEKCYQLSDNQSVLSIKKLERSDCGSFSCNVSNEIQWQEASLNVSVQGIPSNFQWALICAAVALVIFGFSASVFLFLLFKQKQQRKTLPMTLNATAFIGAILFVISISFSVRTIYDFQGQGCAELSHLTFSLAIPALITFIFFLVLSVVYFRRKKRSILENQKTWSHHVHVGIPNDSSNQVKEVELKNLKSNP